MTADSLPDSLPNFPDELKRLRHYVIYRVERRKGKLTKVPYQAGNGRAASTTDSSTWSTFEEAVNSKRRKDGVGLVFDGTGVMGVDLDHVIDDAGKIKPSAKWVLDTLNTYAEISPSGTGIHCLFKGTIPEGGGKKSGWFECYSEGRFFTVTGKHLEGTPTTVEDRHQAFNDVHFKMFGAPKRQAAATVFPDKSENPPSATRPPAGGNGAGVAVVAHQEPPPEEDDAALLTRARNARNGALFSKLYDVGDWEGAHYKSQSEADAALCGLLAFWTDRNPTWMDRLFRDSKLYREKWDSKRGARTYGWEEIEKACFRTTETFKASSPKPEIPASPAPPSREYPKEVLHGSPRVPPAGRPSKPEPPAINAADGDLDRISTIATRALVAGNTPEYIFRHGTLSRIEYDENSNPLVRELTIERTRYELARCARFQTIKKDKNGQEVALPAHPPIAVCKNILAAPDPPFPVLTRIVEVPVFAPDGALQTIPGYHPSSRTFYAPAPGFQVPTVPTNPTGADVRKARQWIEDELLVDFPFESVKEKAHAIGLYVLPYVRDMIDGPTPLHLVEKPCAGTGASLLADAISYPATGRSISAMTEGRDEDEWRKRITSCLAGGPMFVLLDNLKRRLESANVSSAITAMSWQDRRLGHSENIQTPVRCIWIATGNNPSLSAEIARRSVRIRLDTKQDQPWLRTEFKHPHIRPWMRENRQALVWAALVLIQSWIAKGCPQTPEATKRLGGFENWVDVVGGILSAAGIEGFLENLDEFYAASDVEGSTWRGFVEAWWEQFKSKEVGVNDLFPYASDFDLGDGKDRSQRTKLGSLLRNARDRRFGDYRIVRSGKKDGAQQFKLECLTIPTQKNLEMDRKDG